MKSKHQHAAIIAIWITGILFASNDASATQLKGSMHSGFWYLRNNVDKNENYLSQDNYGNSYVQGQYTLLNLRLKLDALDLSDSPTQTKLNAHIDTRALINPLEQPYSLGVPDRYRVQFDNAALEVENLGSKVDLWVGRQTLYASGGLGIDGLRGIFHLNDEATLAVYGGLGNDLRNLTGYIGQSYRLNPVSLDFIAGGTGISLRYPTFQTDVAINSLVYKGSLDRVNLFVSSMYRVSSQVNLSALLDVGVAGNVGLARAHSYLTIYPNADFTYKLGYMRYTTLYFPQSDQSGIPVPTNINSSFTFPTQTDTSAYNVFRNELRYRFDRDSIFGSVEYAKRSYDKKQRLTYSIGYHHPRLFQDFMDMKTQLNVIDNYRGFNTSISLTLGKDFADETFRIETRGVFYANERDLYTNNQFVSGQDELEKEATGQITLLYDPTAKVNWSLSYAFHREIDVNNDKQKISLHDIYLSSSIRF